MITAMWDNLVTTPFRRLAHCICENGDRGDSSWYHMEILLKALKDHIIEEFKDIVKIGRTHCQDATHTIDIRAGVWRLRSAD